MLMMSDNLLIEIEVARNNHLNAFCFFFSFRLELQTTEFYQMLVHSNQETILNYHMATH